MHGVRSIGQIFFFGHQVKRRCDRVTHDSVAHRFSAFNAGGVHRFEIIGLVAILRHGEGIARNLHPFGIARSLIVIGKPVKRVGCRKREGHVFARPAALISAGVHRNDRDTVNHNRERGSRTSAGVLISDVDILFHIEHIGVKRRVIHRVVGDFFGGGVAVIGSYFKAGQIQLVFAFQIFITRVDKRNIRKVFRSQGNREHAAVALARAHDRYQNILLVVENGLVDFADGVVVHLYGEIAVGHAGNIIILCDIVLVVIEFDF